MALPGCWTTISVVAPCAPERPLIYGGVRNWWACITHNDLSAIAGFIGLPDVPLSFVLDTALLPVMLTVELVDRVASSEAWGDGS